MQFSKAKLGLKPSNQADGIHFKLLLMYPFITEEESISNSAGCKLTKDKDVFLRGNE